MVFDYPRAHHPICNSRADVSLRQSQSRLLRRDTNATCRCFSVDVSRPGVSGLKKQLLACTSLSTGQVLHLPIWPKSLVNRNRLGNKIESRIWWNWVGGNQDSHYVGVLYLGEWGATFRMVIGIGKGLRPSHGLTADSGCAYMYRFWGLGFKCHVVRFVINLEQATNRQIFSHERTTNTWAPLPCEGCLYCFVSLH